MTVLSLSWKSLDTWKYGLDIETGSWKCHTYVYRQIWSWCDLQCGQAALVTVGQHSDDAYGIRVLSLEHSAVWRGARDTASHYNNPSIWYGEINPGDT